jgi:hypothetical protein
MFWDAKEGTLDMPIVTFDIHPGVPYQWSAEFHPLIEVVVPKIDPQEKRDAVK